LSSVKHLLSAIAGALAAWSVLAYGVSRRQRMAKSDLAVRTGAFGLVAGVTLAVLVAFVEALSAGLGIVYDHLQLDGRGLLGQSGNPGAAIGLFFDQLRTEFNVLTHLIPVPLPGADMSLIFAALSVLTAYVWIERAKRRSKKRIDLVPLAILAVAALPVLMCVVDLAAL
jgi:hypothetical protein